MATGRGTGGLIGGAGAVNTATGIGGGLTRKQVQRNSPDTPPTPPTYTPEELSRLRSITDPETPPERAADAAEEFIPFAPQDPVLARAVAGALARGERPQEAAQVVEEALANFPEDPGLREMRKLFAKKVDEKPGSIANKASSFIKGLIGKGAEEPEEDGARTADERRASPRESAPDDVQLASIGPAAGAAPARAGVLAQAAAKAGVSQMRLGDTRKALGSFTQAIKEDPANWSAWRLRSLARRRLGDHRGAYDDATQALRLNPRDGWSYKARALTLIDMERWPEAENDLGQALKLDRRDADAYRARSILWERQGLREKMLEDLRRAAELDPAFESLYREAMGAGRPLRSAERSRRWPFVSGAVLLMLLAFWAKRVFGRAVTAVAARPSPSEEPGGIVGFQIVRQLGQGGMGVVYEAFDRALERRVALKRMKDDISADPRERRRFLKEARLVAALKHPNVIEIHSVIEQGADLYLVFEYVQGETLSAVLERRGKLAPGEALSFLKPVAAALDYAHSMGIVHQDLKPSNILVSREGVKVMDFGIARRLQETLSTMSRGEVVGTPAYMAPEQAVGRVLPAADVYALGVCAYQMVSGSLPPPGGGINGFSGAWRGPIARALDSEPQKRFPTAGALVLALEASA